MRSGCVREAYPKCCIWGIDQKQPTQEKRDSSVSLSLTSCMEASRKSLCLWKAVCGMRVSVVLWIRSQADGNQGNLLKGTATCVWAFVVVEISFWRMDQWVVVSVSLQYFTCKIIPHFLEPKEGRNQERYSWVTSLPIFICLKVLCKGLLTI